MKGVRYQVIARHKGCKKDYAWCIGENLLKQRIGYGDGLWVMTAGGSTVVSVVTVKRIPPGKKGPRRWAYKIAYRNPNPKRDVGAAAHRENMKKGKKNNGNRIISG